MLRSISAPLVVVCFISMANAADPGSKRFVYQPNDAQAIPEGAWKGFVATDPVIWSSNKDVLRDMYLEMTKQIADELSEEELRNEIQKLHTRRIAIEKAEEKNRLADEIAGRLTDEAEFLRELSVEHIGTEAAVLSDEIRKVILGEIAKVKKWKAGTLNFPVGVRSYPQTPQRVPQE